MTIGLRKKPLLGRVQMNLKRKAIAAAGVLVLSITGVALVNPASAATPASWIGPVPAKPGAVKGGTVTIINQGDFEHLDPARNYVGGTLDFYRLFVRTLTSVRTVNGKSELVPDLAADLGTTKDGGKTWTFKLRDGIQYEDGSLVSCDDIKYGVARSYEDGVLDGGPTYAQDLLENNNGYKGPYTTPTKDLESVICAADGSTITFKLSNKVPYFGYVTTYGAFSPVPADKDTKQNYDLRPVSTGPYKIESYDRGKQLTLVRNSYWDPTTDPIRWNYPDKFVAKFGSDQNVVENTLISDSGDAKTSLSMDTNIITNLAKVSTDPKYKSRFFPVASPYARYYTINVDTVKDVNVRKAIQCAFDYKQILAAAGGTAAGTYDGSTIPSNVKGAYRKVSVCGRDVTKHPEAQVAQAKAYLAKATDKKTTLILAYRDKGVEPQRAAAVQQELEAVGFKVTMSKYPKAGYYSQVNKRGVANEPDIVQASWAYDWAAASGVVYALFDGRTMTPTDAKQNYSRANFPDLTTLFEKADKSPTATQEKILGDIEQNLIEVKAAHLNVYFENSAFMAGSKLGGLQIDGGFSTLSPLGAYVKK
jgi:peptide/nickel transport system substrate-binding protein